jgi:hypothetical protein
MKSAKSFSSYAVPKGNRDSFLYMYIDILFNFYVFFFFSMGSFKTEGLF